MIQLSKRKLMIFMRRKLGSVMVMRILELDVILRRLSNASISGMIFSAFVRRVGRVNCVMRILMSVRLLIGALIMVFVPILRVVLAVSVRGEVRDQGVKEMLMSVL